MTMATVDYRNKIVLSPMVRVCTLPMRLLAMEYGADLLYCEEIIDFKILSATRQINEVLGTVDYVLSDNTVVFRTIPQEKDRLIFQLGTADAKRALLAAKKIEQDVAGLDINMGCPKVFSIKGGMGAALLKQPDKVKDILTTLVENLSIPVTCKIRILPKLEDTLTLVKLIESTGVAALAVHGRTRNERTRHVNRIHVIRAIQEAVSIPVIANGGSRNITTFKGIQEFWKEAGTSSVMIARAAEWNVSVFRKDGTLPLHEVIKKYLRYAAEYDNNAINTKYCILQMLRETMKEDEGQAMLGITTMEEIYDIWKMKDYYADVMRKRKEREENLRNTNGVESLGIKRRKTDDGCALFELPVRYIKKNYPPCISPKQKLHEWGKRMREKPPQFNTVDRVEDRCFNSVVTVKNLKYTTPFWEKSKQIAEQGAAIACLFCIGVEDGRVEEAEDEREAVCRKWAQFQKDDGGAGENCDVKRKVRTLGQTVNSDQEVTSIAS